MVANYQADHNDKVTMKEDAELRTGPNAVIKTIKAINAINIGIGLSLRFLNQFSIRFI